MPKLEFLDDELFIFTDKPEKIGDIPKIRDVNGHTHFTKEEIESYFEEVVDSRPLIINGQTTSEYGMNECMYCGCPADEEWEWCSDCCKVMCGLCYNETISGVPTKGSQRYEKRKDKLGRCKDHTFIHRQMNNFRACDVCNEAIIDDKRYVKGDSDEDLCRACYNKSKKGWIEVPNLPDLFTFQYNYGSLFDWVPLLTDKEGNLLLYNYNQESKYYQQYALSSIDNHGRTGYFSLPKNTNIEELLLKLEEYYTDPEFEKLEGWDKFYNYPIKRVMEDYGMQIHYG